MSIQVLNAGKDRSWSSEISEVSRTGHSGLLFGRMNVDIVAVDRRGKFGVISEVKCLAISRDLDSIEKVSDDAGDVPKMVSTS